MKLEIPSYKLKFARPVVGFGNFTRQIQNINARSMVDWNIIEIKFKLWDEVIEGDYLTDNGFHIDKDSKDRVIDDASNYRRYLKSILLLKDKTIFTYHNFKKNAKPFKLRWYQDCLISDPYDRILFIGSNQIGKSTTLDTDASTSFITDHNKDWRGLMASNSLTQSKERMSLIRQLLDSSDIDYKTEDYVESSKTGKQLTATIISYTFRDDNGKSLYTNKLICCPHTSAALGYPCDEMWLDEIEFWENCDRMHFIKQVAIPRTFETGGSIKIYSNPLEGGVMEILSKEKDPNTGELLWHVYRFNYWDRKDANQAFFDRSCVGMTKSEVASTLLGDFARAEGSFLSRDEISDQFSSELQQMGDQAGYSKETFWFLDVGSVHDQSALIGGFATPNDNPIAQEMGLPKIFAFYIHKYPVGYPLGRVVGVDPDKLKDNGDDGWEDDVDDNPSVKLVLDEYKENGELPLFGCDVTGNSGISPLFNTVDIDPVDLTFSGPKKWSMYQRYQLYSQQRWFKRCRDRDENTVNGSDGSPSDFAYQASKLMIKKGTSTRYRQVHHENENDLDDTQDAVAGLIYMIENPDECSGDFDIVSSEHGIVTEEVLKEKERMDNEAAELKVKQDSDDRLEDQYIPSFMSGAQASNWLDEKEKNRR